MARVIRKLVLAFGLCDQDIFDDYLMEWVGVQAVDHEDRRVRRLMQVLHRALWNEVDRG